jgi:hypothetical protein
MNHEVTMKQKLLNDMGNLNEPGYSKKEIFEYDRGQIKASKWRIKEWDYYYVGNKDYGLCMTYGDNGYVGSVSFTHLDFKNKTEIDSPDIVAFPFGKMKLPNTSSIGDVSYKTKNTEIHFENDGKVRYLYGSKKNFTEGKDFIFNITLSNNPEESMFIATPFKKKKHFYYNQKINCLEATGYYQIGDDRYEFNKENGSLGVLDWGRGVWTYNNTWYWASLSTYLEDGSKVGFNLGYGFGDTSAASENMIFYNGTAHKTDLVDFGIPGDKEGKPRYMDTWNFTSNDNRVNLTFKPIYDRNTPLDIKIIKMLPHQVFGLFSGTLVLDDGKVIELKDALGFAEKVHNQW